MWHSYIQDASLIVFMIDGGNFDKKGDVEVAIQEMLSNEHIGEKIILFLINKNVHIWLSLGHRKI